jgi:hypothetical protein
MSTTRSSSDYYVVKPRGQTARVYPSVAQAATAITQLASTPATVSVMTGRRTRSLTDTELSELGKHVQGARRHARPGQAERAGNASNGTTEAIT